MSLLLFRLILTIYSLHFLSSVCSRRLTKSHRGVPHPGAPLEYAQSPTEFLHSKGYNQGNTNNYNSDVSSRNTYSPDTFRKPDQSTNSFSAALPYDKYVPQGSNTRSIVDTQPTATLYNNNIQSNIPYNRGGKSSSSSSSTASKFYDSSVSNSASGNPNIQVAQPHTSQPSNALNSARTYIPEDSNVQKKLNFDLFNAQDFGQTVPQFGRGTPRFGRGSSDFGRDSSNFGRRDAGFDQGSSYGQSNPFSRNTEKNLFQPQQKFPYDIAVSSQDQIGNGYSNHFNTGFNYNGFSPILSQGFSVPTTYNGEQKTDILPNEAFSSVTDPKSNKRVAISSYVPSNNFVNPSNFLIPTEDKYDMISRIFGGFKVPTQSKGQQQKQQQQKEQPSKQNQHNRQPSPYSIKSPATDPYSSYNSFNNDFNYNPNTHQSSFDKKHSTASHNANYGNKNDNSITGNEMVAASTQVKDQGSYVSGSKSLAKPGYGQGFENQGTFSYSPVQSAAVSGYNNNNNNNNNNNINNKGSIFGVKENPPTLLFSDFTNNSPLSLNQFRSKNLLGDENFGQTAYDNNRLTPDSLFERNNKNYYQNGDFFAPSSNSQVTGTISGTNGYKQIGGATASTKNSYDKSYSKNKGYDKSFDDNNHRNGIAEGYAPQNGGYSDQSSYTDGYDDTATYSDGDGYSNTFRYSDGGSDSNYRSTDDSNEDGYEKSYENNEDDSNTDSYNDAQGYNRVHYDGNNFDVEDGYTDNVKYDASSDKDSNIDHFSTDSNDGDGVNNYRQGLGKVAAALAASVSPTVQPYRGLTKSVSDDLPGQANYKPFNVNGPVVE